jgi:hypothetical protein
LIRLVYLLGHGAYAVPVFDRAARPIELKKAAGAT